MHSSYIHSQEAPWLLHVSYLHTHMSHRYHVLDILLDQGGSRPCTRHIMCHVLA
ncbi:hypothetical protein X975_25939, partial [Stegodyphus mimosarum]